MKPRALSVNWPMSACAQVPMLRETRVNKSTNRDNRNGGSHGRAFNRQSATQQQRIHTTHTGTDSARRPAARTRHARRRAGDGRRAVAGAQCLRWRRRCRYHDPTDEQQHASPHPVTRAHTGAQTDAIAITCAHTNAGAHTCASAGDLFRGRYRQRADQRQVRHAAGQRRRCGCRQRQWQLQLPDQARAGQALCSDGRNAAFG